MTQARVVLVTGGMGGLGETISTKMVDAGYKVAVTYSPGNNRHVEWVAQMKENGYDILAVPCDVTDIHSCASAVARTQDELGPIDVLVNNAGITRDMTFKKMDKVNWDAVLRTNLDSLFNMTKRSPTAWSSATGAASSTCLPSTVPKAHSARPITRQPSPGYTVSRKH